MAKGDDGRIQIDEELTPESELQDLQLPLLELSGWTLLAPTLMSGRSVELCARTRPSM